MERKRKVIRWPFKKRQIWRELRPRRLDWLGLKSDVTGRGRQKRRELSEGKLQVLSPPEYVRKSGKWGTKAV